MADDDDDDVAIEDSGATDATDTVAAGGPIAAVLSAPSGTRPISDKVRQAFAASMAKMKTKPSSDDEEGGLEPMDVEGEPVVEAPAPAGVQEAAPAPAAVPAPAALAAPAAAPPTPAPPAPVQPPAPSLDPEVMRLRADLQTEREKLEQERQAFQQERASGDLAKLRDTYFDKGAPAIIDVVKQWMPGLEGEDLKREVADLIQDLAHQYLDAPIEEAVKDRITNKRVRAGLKTWKQEQERLEQDRQSKLQAHEREQTVLQTKRILHQEVTKPEHAAKYPFLTAEDKPGDLIYEVVEQEHRKSGTTISWEEAAQIANDWLKKQSLAYYDKRKHLLSPTPPAPQAAPADTQRAQGDTQVSRSHAPPKKPTPPPPPSERPVQKWTPEQHRANTMNKFRGQLKALTEDE